MDYKNGKIYRLVCNVSGRQYIGSTTQSLTKRKSKHKNHFKRWKDGKHDYVKAFQIIENDDYDIILIEDYPCQSKNELERRERYWIETLECINKNIPTRTIKEWKETNKDKIKHQNKNWWEEHKEEINKRRREQTTCECGGRYTHDKTRHFKTQKHIKWQQQQTK